MKEKSIFRLAADKKFEKLCREVPKSGFYFIGIKHIKGDKKRPKAFMIEIEEDTLAEAAMKALGMLTGRIKTTLNEPLRLFHNGKLKRKFTDI